MIKAQFWLDQNYPSNGICEINNNKGKTRAEITKLDISKQLLEGDLDLADFVKLQVLYCDYNQLTSLNLSNCLQLRVIDCFINNLTNLDLNNCRQLREINCSNNQLTKLELSNLSQLKVLICRYNPITDLNLKNNSQLEEISLYGSLISADLNIFSHLINLKKLNLGFKFDKYTSNNNFSGSLKALENCQNLECLGIGYQPNITEGLEYLPTENLTHFGCHGTAFAPILEPYNYDVGTWQSQQLSHRQKNDSFLSDNFNEGNKVVQGLDQVEEKENENLVAAEHSKSDEEIIPEFNAEPKMKKSNWALLSMIIIAVSLILILVLRKAKQTKSPCRSSG